MKTSPVWLQKSSSLNIHIVPFLCDIGPGSWHDFKALLDNVDFFEWRTWQVSNCGIHFLFFAWCPVFVAKLFSIDGTRRDVGSFNIAGYQTWSNRHSLTRIPLPHPVYFRQKSWCINLNFLSASSVLFTCGVTFC